MLFRMFTSGVLSVTSGMGELFSNLSTVDVPKTNIPKSSKRSAPSDNLKSMEEGVELGSRDVDAVT